MGGIRSCRIVHEHHFDVWRSIGRFGCEVKFRIHVSKRLFFIIYSLAYQLIGAYKSLYASVIWLQTNKISCTAYDTQSYAGLSMVIHYFIMRLCDMALLLLGATTRIHLWMYTYACDYASNHIRYTGWAKTQATWFLACVLIYKTNVRICLSDF